MRSESEVLIDCVQRLNGCGIAYMLTGSMASNSWGLARYTHDIDIVVHYTAADVPTLLAAFANGYFIQESSIRSGLRPPYQFNAIDEQSPLKIDFWVLRNEPFEQEMFRRRVQLDLEGNPTWTATAEDILLHKLYWNKLSPSERQLLDAAGIFAVQEGSLDLPYMRQWAGVLDVSDTLERILCGDIRPKST